MNSWRAVCPVARLPPGRDLTVLLDGRRIVVRRVDGGEVVAHSDEGRRHLVRVREDQVEVCLAQAA